MDTAGLEYSLVDVEQDTDGSEAPVAIEKPKKDAVPPLSYTADTRDKVEKARGPAQLERVLIVLGETETTDIWSHELIVNHITFHVIEAAFEILQEGDVYAIYYAKHLRQILSVERFPEQP